MDFPPLVLLLYFCCVLFFFLTGFFLEYDSLQHCLRNGFQIKFCVVEDNQIALKVHPNVKKTLWYVFMIRVKLVENAVPLNFYCSMSNTVPFLY